MTKVPVVTYVIVGFRVDQTKSCYYAKANSIEDCMDKMLDCFTKAAAQFASIRVIPPQVEYENNKATEILTVNKETI